MSARLPRLPGLAAEGLVVVVSILIAFGLDAWWDERQLARDVREDLASLENEVTKNLDDVRATAEIQARIVEASRALNRRLEAEAGSPLVAVTDTLVWWVAFVNPTLDASFGGIDALIGSGRLAAIEDPALRQELAILRGRLVDVVEEQVVARRMAVEQIYPLLRSSFVDLQRMSDIMTGGVTPRPLQGTEIRAVPSYGPVTVPNSADLRFTVAMRALWYQASTEELAGVERALEETLDMIRSYRTGGTRRTGSPDAPEPR